MLTKSYIFLIFLAIEITCFIPEFLKSDCFNIYRHAAVQTREIQDKPVDPDNVTYYLYTVDNPYRYIKLDPKRMDVLGKRGGKVVFFIHGWTNSREIDWYENLKDAFLATYGGAYSIVQVDWKDPANQFYYVSSINTYDVAQYLAQVIVDLHRKYHIELKDVLLVGHSLGGQITGFVGKHIQKMVGKKLPRVIALDPAGPFFDGRPDDKRLNKDDAEVVEVIHTDGGTFGFKGACGTIDIFPNGGSTQPGCKRIDLSDLKSIIEPINCDHHRAYDYFVEAILNPGEMIAKRCENWNSYKNNKCDNVKIPLGDLGTRLVGKFYLETNKDKPYSRRANTKESFGISKVLSIITG